MILQSIFAVAVIGRLLAGIVSEADITCVKAASEREYAPDENPAELLTLQQTISDYLEMDAYYGCYQITRFYSTIYYSDRKYDVLPEQEADMMLGHVIIMEPERLVTYDSERVLGKREGRAGFDGNYIIEAYTIENPQYRCEAVTSDAVDFSLKLGQDMKSAIGDFFYEQIGSIIIIPQLCSPYGTQYYYTLSDADKMIMYSTLSCQYFLLEKMNQEQERILPKELSDVEKKQLLEEIYGAYEVVEFLPTKFYPAKDSCGYEILPQEEADMMLGQEIVIKEEVFNTYDNNRQPNSWIANRLEDGFWIEKVEIHNPEYRVECKLREDIYGMRDDMLPKELQQQEYIEIDVYPGYDKGANTLPQLFLTENGKIIMYAMGEYFLLESANDRLPYKASAPY
ncbi:MAG: hypothetical protein K2K70_01530 [Lachnospiraceae bacterium]|nr:hypothetical protein [Lachnospiraceae bacterium]